MRSISAAPRFRIHGKARQRLIAMPASTRIASVFFYAYRVGFLLRISQLEEAPLERIEALEQLRVLWHGYRIAVVVSPREIPPGVDTPRDLEAVRKMLA